MKELKIGNFTIKNEWVKAFLGTLIIGLLTHMFALTHNFLTIDSLWNLYSDQDMISSGRQFLMYACGITSYFSLPWLNGLVAIFYLAVTSVFVVELFDLKGSVLPILAGAFLVTIPAFSSTMAYAYTIDGYMLAVLLSVLAVYLSVKFKFGFLFGILCLGLSLGIYQAYLSLTILLCIFVLLFELLTDVNFKKFLILALKFVGMGIGGYAFYVITLKLMMAVKGSAFSGYQGTDKVLSFGLPSVSSSISAVKYNFHQAFHVLTLNPWLKGAFLLFAFLGALGFLTLLIKNKTYKCWWKLVIMALLAICIPFGTCTVSILSPDTFFHQLMLYPTVAFFIFVTAIISKMLSETEWKRPLNYLPAASSIVGFVLIFALMVSSNVVYFNLNERYEKTYSFCLRMADRIEACEGYHTGVTVAILGGVPDREYYPDTDITASALDQYFGVNGDFIANSSESYAEFFKHYLGVTIITQDINDDIALTETEEFKNMPKYPSDGSIGFIGDVLVVKLNG